MRCLGYSTIEIPTDSKFKLSVMNTQQTLSCLIWSGKVVYVITLNKGSWSYHNREVAKTKSNSFFLNIQEFLQIWFKYSSIEFATRKKKSWIPLPIKCKNFYAAKITDPQKFYRSENPPPAMTWILTSQPLLKDKWKVEYSTLGEGWILRSQPLYYKDSTTTMYVLNPEHTLWWGI